MNSYPRGLIGQCCKHVVGALHRLQDTARRPTVLFSFTE